MTPAETLTRAILNAYNRALTDDTRDAREVATNAAIATAEVELRRVLLEHDRKWLLDKHEGRHRDATTGEEFGPEASTARGPNTITSDWRPITEPVDTEFRGPPRGPKRRL